MKRAETGDGIAFSPVPRFRRRNGTAKIQTVKGVEGGDFFAAYKRKNTTCPLTVWIVGTAV